MKTQDNLLTEWAALLMGSFADAGVTEVVISPGSRSTPFVVAAARNGRLSCHDSIDERAAAFFALGQARVTGRPSVLICTSGTAGAHYLPAIIEAQLAHVPLIVLTADRPFELQQCGASQTIDQVKLFGDHVRGFFELGAPDAFAGSLRAVRRIAAQAVAQSAWPVPGVVHVNARARKPLEPATAVSSEEVELRASVEALLASPIASLAAPRLAPDPAAISEVAQRIRAARRGVIVAGAAPLQQASARGAIQALAAASGFPLLAEAASQLSSADGPFDPVLRSVAFRRVARPDLILQIGAFPVSTGFERYAGEHLECPNVVIAPYGWHDPFSRSTLHLVADVELAARALAGELGAAAERSPWVELFQSAAREAAQAAARAAEPEDGALNEGGAARLLVRAAPPGSALLLGNSLAIRLVDTFAAAKELAVLSQRGAAGIDGLISGAAGSAGLLDRPLGVLLGDVSFFHDTTGLALARSVRRQPLVIVVIQNRGGRIFEQLPIASAGVEPEVLAHITTPHQLEVEPACRAFGARYASAASRSELQAELTRAYASPGCTVVEAVVPPQDATPLFQRVWKQTDAALAPLLESWCEAGE